MIAEIMKLILTVLFLMFVAASPFLYMLVEVFK